MHTLLTEFLLIVLIFGVSEALMCYQCANTARPGDCIDNIEGLINATKGMKKYRYTNNCTDSKPSWDRCVIQQHFGEKDALTLFLRGCHDGKHFNSAFHDKRFDNLAPNNKTTCAQKEQRICYTFCNTDFCNGPQPPNITDPCLLFGYNSTLCDGCSQFYHWTTLYFSWLCMVISFALHRVMFLME